MKVTKAAALACSAFAFAAAGCDPCSGVQTCSPGPHLTVEGSMLNHGSGLPWAGSRIDVIRTGGARLSVDSVSTTTDASGYWGIDIPALEEGDVTVTLSVTNPQFGSYRVIDQHFTTTTRRGDGHLFGALLVDPYFPFAAEFYYHGTSDRRAADVVVLFIRRSGISYYTRANVTNPVYGGRTDGAGRIALFDVGAHTSQVGDMIGDIVVLLPSPFAPDTIHDVRLTSTPRLNTPQHLLRYGVGPSLLYVGEFRERRNNNPASGVRVTFRRTSGPLTDPQSFTATTDANGRFLFPLNALGEGAVTGDLDVVPRLGTPTTIRNVVLRPHRHDDAQFYGSWAIGPALPWAALVQIGGRPAAGVTAEFHRTGGIAVTPSDFTKATTADGYLFLNPQPDAVGTVEGDVIIHSPPPYAEFRTHVSLPTVETDTGGGVFTQWNLDLPHAAGAAPSPAPSDYKPIQKRNDRL